MKDLFNILVGLPEFRKLHFVLFAYPINNDKTDPAKVQVYATDDPDDVEVVLRAYFTARSLTTWTYSLN